MLDIIESNDYIDRPSPGYVVYINDLRYFISDNSIPFLSTNTEKVYTNEPAKFPVAVMQNVTKLLQNMILSNPQIKVNSIVIKHGIVNGADFVADESK